MRHMLIVEEHQKYKHNCCLSRLLQQDKPFGKYHLLKLKLDQHKHCIEITMSKLDSLHHMDCTMLLLDYKKIHLDNFVHTTFHFLNIHLHIVNN